MYKASKDCKRAMRARKGGQGGVALSASFGIVMIPSEVGTGTQESTPVT